MSEKVRVNIRTTVNKKTIRKERRNGRDIIVVSSATLPDNVVMNGIMYPADEIEKSYKGLNGTPAPLGHPNIDGVFVSASHPEGMVRGFVGAWNENVRRENGRVFLDKIIDVGYASQLTGGKSVLEAIEKGDAIHTSTGLYGILEEVKNAKDGEPSKIMREIVFDHDAILLGEEGAATPDQGVGMLVNSAKDPEGGSVALVNSAIDRAEDDVDWAGMYLLDSLQKMEKASKWEQIKASLMKMLTGNTETQDGERAMNEAQFKDVSDKLDKLTGTMEGLGGVIANALKPVSDMVTSMQAQATATQNAEKATLVTKVVEAKLLTEAVANTLDLPALKELADAIKTPPGKAAPLNPVFSNTGDNVKSFSLPKVEG